MKSICSTTNLLVALAAPLTVLSQDWTKSVDWSTVDYSGAFPVSAPAAPPVAAPSPAPSPDTPPVVVANKLAVKPPPSASSGAVQASVTPSKQQPSPTTSTPAAASSSSPPSSDGPSNSPTTCSSSNGMMIQWTKDSESVPWSHSGGSGTTTPGTCTDLGNFSGQLAINGLGGTIFEGNYNGGNQFFDVSFIIGYSAPMMCTSSLGKSGCSIDLFAQAAAGGYSCPQPSGDSNVCTNPNGSNGNANDGGFKGDMHGFPWCRACSAPDPFFQPCSGAGYTYPYDDGATQSVKKDETIQCCIGTKCGKTGREGSTKNGNPQPNRSAEPCMPCSGGSKRGLEGVSEKGAMDMTPKLLKRGHKHRHGHAHFHAAKAGQ